MFAKVDAALRDVMYLMGEYIVFATVDISSIEVAAGVVEQYQEIMVHRF